MYRPCSPNPSTVLKIRKICRPVVLLVGALALFGYPLTAAQDRVSPAAEQSGQAEPQKQVKAGYRYWTTRWALQDIDLPSLSKRMKSIGFELPAEIQGTASIDFLIGVPLNALGTPSAYQFSGSFTARDVQLENTRFPELSATVTFDDGKLNLTKFKGRTESGEFHGTASASVFPRGDFEGELTVAKLKLGPLVELFGKLSDARNLRTLTGIADGTVKVSGQFDQLANVSAWDASGRLQIENFSVGKSSKYSINMAEFTLSDQTVKVPQLKVTSADHASFFLNGDIDFRLDETQAFKISLQANDMPAADVLGLYFPNSDSWVEGKLDLKGQAQGKLAAAETGAPMIEANLLIASPQAQVFGIDLGLIEHKLRLTTDRIELTPLFPTTTSDRRKIDFVKARYSIDDQWIELEELDASIFGGVVKGNGSMSRSETGNHRIAVNWQGIEPSIGFPWSPSKVHLAGKSSGSIRWSVPAEKFPHPGRHTGKVVAEFESVKVNGEDLGSLSAQAEVLDSQFRLFADGDLLGGETELTSQADLQPTIRWNDLPQIALNGNLILRQLALGDAVRVLSETDDRRYSGRLDGRVDFQLQANATPQWNASLDLRDFSIDQRPISRLLKAKLSQQENNIAVESIDGSYAGGKLQASGTWSLAAGKRLIHARLVRAEGRSLLLPFGKLAGQSVDGLISGRASIAGIGSGVFDGVRVTGALRTAGGQAYGVPIGDAHSPFRVHINRTPLQWEATFPAVNTKLARGSVRGKLSLSSHRAGSGINLDSDWRITHVDFETLLSRYLQTSTIGRGDLTGQLSLSGRRIDSLNDLQGRFRFKLGGSDATAIPGLSAFGSTLGVLPMSGVRFTDGEAKGQIGKGAIRIEQLALLSDRMRVEASGRSFPGWSPDGPSGSDFDGQFPGSANADQSVQPAGFGGADTFAIAEPMVQRSHRSLRFTGYSSRSPSSAADSGNASNQFASPFDSAGNRTGTG